MTDQTPTDSALTDPLNRHTDYGQTPLTEQDIDPDPLAQFATWLEQAAESGVYEPNAMVLATIDPDGGPSSRTVLLRTLDGDGFQFFTNYGSAKGLALLHSPRVALVFPWYTLHRQVLIRGEAVPTTPEISDAYFATRPRGSQIAAAASEQSRPIASREQLEARVRELEEQYAGHDVPRPETWGGYRVTPHSIEFWQGRSSRMHDRLRFTRDGAGWRRERLHP